ncbi:hypothetical protein Aduo_001430 [Ancylostoma duodenale]
MQNIRRALWRKHTNPRERLYFATSAYIQNVESGLALQHGRLDDDDLTSIQKRFDLPPSSDGMRRLEFPETGDNRNFCLIIVTPEQEEFSEHFSGRGISIDDTQCTTKYQVKLSTLMVAENYGRGLEVTFMISYKVDTKTCIKLFEVVKDVYPKYCKSCFLPDDT